MQISSLRLHAFVLGLCLILGLLATTSPAHAFGDCPLIGTLENFDAGDNPRVRTYDAEEFQIVDGGETKTIVKQGRTCKQDYSLKSGMARMSGLEIMQNYAEGLPSLGFKITNTKRADDDEIFATITKGSTEYWAHVWESNGDGLHILVLTVAPFKGAVVAAGAQDCPLVPIQQNFQTSNPPQLRTFDSGDFVDLQGGEPNNVTKSGKLCRQDYGLKPGIGLMSALEIMQNYAEALPAAGMTITNAKRAPEDDVYAKIVKSGVTYWVHVWESNGDGLHTAVLSETAFKGAVVAAGALDCPLVPVQQNFQTSNPPQLRNFDTQDFVDLQAGEQSNVRKSGKFCRQDYELKPGVGLMSGLEIMQNYAEALPAAGMTITNAKRGPEDEVYAKIAKDGATYWIHVWESNGDGLHTAVLTETAFKADLVAAGDKDCPIIPVQQNFQNSGGDYARNYDVAEFTVAKGDGNETIKKYGKVCERDYGLKPGVEIMSGVEIMRNYAEAAGSVGYTITNTHRADDDDVYATLTKDGAEYWFKIWESNGDGLHIMSLEVQPFRSSVSDLGPKDCPLAPALANFQAANPPQSKSFEAMDFRIVDGDQEKTITKKGKTCRQDYGLKPGVKTMSGLEIMLNYAQALPAEGLTITNTRRADDDDIYATITKDGVESWVHLWESNGDGLHTQVLQIEPFHSSMKAAAPADDSAAAPTPAPVPTPTPTPVLADVSLPQPAATPENVTPETGDFPYLPPLPGSVLSSGRARTEPFYVQPSDAKQPELVAKDSIVKAYMTPPGLRPEQVASLYRAALVKAQWSIVAERKGEGGGGSLTAHYGLNGRNIWLVLQIGEKIYVFEVADATVGEAKLAADLGVQCHLALTGVLFDFNKSKLKPESDAILEQVAAVMTKEADLKLEVQGHTDGVGSQAFNLPLSKARAHSVVVWLTDHGIAAGRLDAQGFGKLKPVASNDTDEGRAQNRRVEIANKACKAADP